MRRQADFTRVFRQGRHNSARLMAVRSISNGRDLSRFAYSVSKRVGNAVVRNKVKRRLREAMRSLPFREGFDVVLVVRPEAALSDYQALRSELQMLMRRADLLRGQDS